MHYSAILQTNAPLLLRAPDGILKHPSVAPSLPGKAYSTLSGIGTRSGPARDFFVLPRCNTMSSFKQKLCEHVSGSLLNFLDHASPGGQIPIVMTADESGSL